MKRFFLLPLGLFSCVLLSINIASAQQRTITGTVVDEGGKPLAGVTVSSKGKDETSVITDKDGKFSIGVDSSARVLSLTSVGLASQTVRIGRGSGAIGSITMQIQEDQLEEVVVTALGIEKERKALGYAVTDIGGEAFESKPESDFSRLLGGKAPGLDITSSSGMTGSGVSLNIRGFSSVTGGSTPLVVVNGVPFNANTNSSGAQFFYGSQSSSRLLDIDPNSIEDVSVLKGLSATALYGELGRNGVILITTKAGASALDKDRGYKGLGVTVSQSVNVTTVSQIPETQRSWGGGFNNVSNVVFFSNWGGRTDVGTVIEHPYDKANYNALFPEFKSAKYEYKDYNSVERFFSDVGIASNTSLSIDGGNEKVRANAAFSYLDDKGFIKTNTLKRFNFGVGFSMDLNHGFNLKANMNYVSSAYTSPPISYSSGSSSNSGPSIFGDVMYTPLTVDMMDLPYASPVDHSSIYYRNNNGIQHPLWTLHNAKFSDKTDRTYGNIGISNSNLIKNVQLSYRVGWDFYSQNQQNYQNRGGVATSAQANLGRGYLRTIIFDNFIFDHLALASYSNSWKNISLSAQLGFNYTYRQYRQEGTFSEGQIIFNLLDHSNFIDHDNVNLDGDDLGFVWERFNLGTFYDITLDYKAGVYLNLLGRYDQSSALPETSGTLFYPSFSVSFLPTTMIGALSDLAWFNYMKVRVGYATSARFPNSYSVRQAASIASNAFTAASGTAINSGSLSGLKANPDIKPELVREFEVGLELRFLRSRLSLDFTYFSKESTDQILSRSLDRSTGFSSQLVNRGGVRNTGYEIVLGVVPLKTQDWNINVNFNFYSYRNLVFGLGEGETIRLAGFTNLGVFAVNDQPLSVLMGRYFITAEDGQRVVNADNGRYKVSSDIRVIGDPNPDFQLNTTLSVSFRGLSLSAQFDYKQGGQVYSVTARSMLARGLAKETDFDRYQSVILKGVIEKGGVYVPNNVQVDVTEGYFQTVFGANEIAVYSATLLRLRDITLSYALPARLLAKVSFIQGVSVSVSANNLWYYAPGFPAGYNVDTDVNAFGSGISARGIEALSGPSATKYSFNLRVTM